MAKKPNKLIIIIITTIINTHTELMFRSNLRGASGVHFTFVTVWSCINIHMKGRKLINV